MGRVSTLWRITFAKTVARDFVKAHLLLELRIEFNLKLDNHKYLLIRYRSTSLQIYIYEGEREREQALPARP